MLERMNKGILQNSEFLVRYSKFTLNLPETLNVYYLFVIDSTPFQSAPSSLVIKWAALLSSKRAV